MPFVLGLVLFFGLFFPKQAFAAVTIDSISPIIINDPEDIITLNVTITTSASQKDTTQYIQTMIIKEGGKGAFGLTKNSQNEWFQYKSTPTDFQSYLFSFVPGALTWSGQIWAKIDTSSENFVGPDNYAIKFRKYITTTSSYAESNEVSFVVNIATPSTQLAEIQETSRPIVPVPKIDWNLEDKVFVGRDFKTTKLELSNFDVNAEYFLKLRAGTEEGKLTKIQTKNGSAYLSDGESWDKFPLIKTNENAKWTGEIKGILAESKPDGRYKILVRIRKKDTESFYESEIKEINFSKVAEETIIIVTPVVATKSSIVATPAAQIKTKEPEVLGATTEIATPTPVKTLVSPKKDFSPLAILGGGLIFVATIMAGFLHKNELWDIISRYYGKNL